METLKLIGSGYKVLLVKDDAVKYVEPGGLFSSKKEFLFSVGNITSVDVKKPESFSPGSILICGNNIVPPLQNKILVAFKGDDSYKIALAMQQHIKNFAVSSVKEPESSKSEEDEELPVIHIPDKINGKRRAYRCPSVQISNFNVDTLIELAKNQKWQLDVKFLNGVCGLYSGDLKVGEILNEDVAGMLSDWISSGNPYLVYLFEVYDEENEAYVSIAFYLDRREKLANRDYDIVKLTSYLSEDAQTWIGHIDEGEELGIHEDFNYDTGKDYVGVFWDETEIGHLPSRYASRFLDQGKRIHGCFFEECSTNDNLKDVPYVRIYW